MDRNVQGGGPVGSVIAREAWKILGGTPPGENLSNKRQDELWAVLPQEGGVTRLYRFETVAPPPRDNGGYAPEGGFLLYASRVGYYEERTFQKRQKLWAFLRRDQQQVPRWGFVLGNCPTNRWIWVYRPVDVHAGPAGHPVDRTD